MSYPMSPEQYRKALKEFNLEQGEASLIFGGKSDRSGRRWASEGAPYHVALLISVMRDHQLSVEDIEAAGARWRSKK